MDNHKNVECSGLLIRCLVESIHQLNIIPQALLEAKLADLAPSTWYAIGKLTEILHSIAQVAPIAQNVYFQAGNQLASIVHKQASSNSAVNAHDWLNENIRRSDNSASPSQNLYKLEAHDANAKTAVYACENTLPVDYVKGYFYGCYSQGDFECVEISLLNALQNSTDNFNISVRYIATQNASISQPNRLSLKDQLQADFQQEISQLLQASIAKQMADSAMMSKLNAELIEQRDKIARLANHDPVTGLASLRLGRDRLRMACNTAKRNNVKAAVMLIDLDGFKQANSQYGHVVGDAILKTVAERIIKSIRATDSAVRQSGDSFLIILSNFNEVQSLGIVAKRVISAISEPITFETLTLKIACNIGIAIYPDETDAAEQMIKCADKAIRTIKKSARNQFAFYENAN